MPTSSFCRKLGTTRGAPSFARVGEPTICGVELRECRELSDIRGSLRFEGLHPSVREADCLVVAA